MSILRLISIVVFSILLVSCFRVNPLPKQVNHSQIELGRMLFTVSNKDCYRVRAIASFKRAFLFGCANDLIKMLEEAGFKKRCVILNDKKFFMMVFSNQVKEPAPHGWLFIKSEINEVIPCK